MYPIQGMSNELTIKSSAKGATGDDPSTEHAFEFSLAHVFPTATASERRAALESSHNDFVGAWKILSRDHDVAQPPNKRQRIADELLKHRRGEESQLVFPASSKPSLLLGRSVLDLLDGCLSVLFPTSSHTERREGYKLGHLFHPHGSIVRWLEARGHVGVFPPEPIQTCSSGSQNVTQSQAESDTSFRPSDNVGHDVPSADDGITASAIQSTSTASVPSSTTLKPVLASPSDPVAVTSASVDPIVTSSRPASPPAALSSSDVSTYQDTAAAPANVAEGCSLKRKNPPMSDGSAMPVASSTPVYRGLFNDELNYHLDKRGKPTPTIPAVHSPHPRTIQGSHYMIGQDMEIVYDPLFFVKQDRPTEKIQPPMKPEVCGKLEFRGYLEAVNAGRVVVVKANNTHRNQTPMINRVAAFASSELVDVYCPITETGMLPGLWHVALPDKEAVDAAIFKYSRMWGQHIHPYYPNTASVVEPREALAANMIDWTSSQSFRVVEVKPLNPGNLSNPTGTIPSWIPLTNQRFLSSRARDSSSRCTPEGLTTAEVPGHDRCLLGHGHSPDQRCVYSHGKAIYGVYKQAVIERRILRVSQLCTYYEPEDLVWHIAKDLRVQAASIFWPKVQDGRRPNFCQIAIPYKKDLQNVELDLEGKFWHADPKNTQVQTTHVREGRELSEADIDWELSQTVRIFPEKYPILDHY
ncbi:hypothetical protein F5Y18DRAFT_442385 [Xylariaceae sp. FL1019]|nr:hypothetical protein F5Y18DRAFT_442385 [Xylariaceae sp. FL1019]